MHLLFIGSGFVGTTTAAVMASFGHDVIVFDIDKQKIAKLGSRDRAQIESCLFEAGLARLLIQHAKRIHFTHQYDSVEAALDRVDAIFICVPTPPLPSGATNMQYYDRALHKLAAALSQRNKCKQNNYILLINKSTIPIETANYALEIFSKYRVKNVGVGANPEFLVEGKAIEDNLHPFRVIVGAWNKKDFAILRRIYAPLLRASKKPIPYLEVNPYEAAAGKLLSNYSLFLRIMSCFDVMGRLAEVYDGVNFEKLRTIVTSDPRIGPWGFYDSLYAGGSCLDKDTKSLTHQLVQKIVPAPLVHEAYNANERQLERLFVRIRAEAGLAMKGETIALLGLAFKRDTNDMRNSAGPMALARLLQQGVREVRVYDPVVDGEAIYKLPELSNARTRARVTVCKNATDALKGTRACIIATDWPEFARLAPILLRKKRPFTLIDGRRMLASMYMRLAKKGIAVLPVGGPFLPTKLSR